MFNSKDLHPYLMHSTLKGIKISHGSSFPSTHTKPYPLWATPSRLSLVQTPTECGNLWVFQALKCTYWPFTLQ
jgi:hypothetical protein